MGASKGRGTFFDTSKIIYQQQQEKTAVTRAALSLDPPPTAAAMRLEDSNDDKIDIDNIGIYQSILIVGSRDGLIYQRIDSIRTNMIPVLVCT